MLQSEESPHIAVLSEEFRKYLKRKNSSVKQPYFKVCLKI
jgi:hypothetical protein